MGAETSRVNRKSTVTVNMPQVTELEKGAPIVHDGSDNTDSDSDDDVPELEETQATGQSQVAAAAGLPEELVSKEEHVQIGLETGCWSQPRHYPQVQEHPLRHQQT